MKHYYNNYERIKKQNRENIKKWRKNNPDKARLQYRNHREKGFICLFLNTFPEEIKIEYHHIYRHLPVTIPIPKITHRFKLGHHEIKQMQFHENHCKEWIEKIYQLDIKKIFNEFI